MSATRDNDQSRSDALIVSVHRAHPRKSRSDAVKSIATDERKGDIVKKNIKSEVNHYSGGSNDTVIDGDPLEDTQDFNGILDTQGGLTSSVAQQVFTESRRASTRLSTRKNNNNKSRLTSLSQNVAASKSKAIRALATNDLSRLNIAVPVGVINKRRTTNERRKAARAAESLDVQISLRATSTNRVAKKSATERAVLSDAVSSKRAEDAKRVINKKLKKGSRDTSSRKNVVYANKRKDVRGDRSSDVAKRSLNAQRMAAKRLAEAPEARATRLAAEARRMSAKRAAEAAKLKARHLAGVKERRATRRATDLSDSNAQQLAAYAQKRREQRGSVSVEDILARRARNAQRMAAKRAAETPERRAARLAADARRMAAKRAAESANNRAHRLATDAKLKAAKRVACAPDFNAAQRRLVSRLDAASGLSVDLHEDLTAEHLQYFKLDPMVALLAIATDIGIAYMSQHLAPKYPGNTQPNTVVEVKNEHETRNCGIKIPQMSETYDRLSFEEISDRDVIDALGLSAVVDERDVHIEKRQTGNIDESLLVSVDSAIRQCLAESAQHDAPPNALPCGLAADQKDSTELPPDSSLSLLDIIRTSKRAFFTGGDPFVCDKCNERFTEWSHLHDHMNLHAAERTYFNKTSTKPLIPHVLPLSNGGSGLNGGVSVLRIHTVDRPFVCATCNRRFTHKSHLDKHQRIHSGELPFSCATCNTGFQRAADLRRHEGLHSSARPHLCDVCHLNFSTVARLLKHKRRNHSGERRYVCEICKKGFTQVNYLRAHFDQMHPISPS